MKNFKSYLSTLKFDPRLWNGWHAKYLTNFRLVLLLIIGIVAVGLVSYGAIPRRLNPELKIPIVVVTTALPGASPTDVEALVTTPIEDKLNGMKDLDTYTSVSQENFSAITIQFRSGIDPDDAKDDVQSIVDTVTTLPEDATDPSVRALDFEDQPIWNFAVVTNTDTASLMRFAKILQDRIKNLPKVDRVEIAGFETQEIQVVIDVEKIKQYNINPAQLSQTISRATNSYPAGNLVTGSSTIALSIDPGITTIDDLRTIQISQQGQIVRLSDVATIIERSPVNRPEVFYAAPGKKTTKAIQFFIYKTSASNIDAAEKEVHVVVDETMKQYEGRFTLITIMNTAEQIVEQFDDLIHEFQSTIMLVFINLLIFLGLRQAIISSLTFPLTFMVSIAVLNAMGLSLNFLTMFAFLLALGLLIDDTIVTVAAMTRYYATGKFTPAEAGLLVWKDFITPLWSTTITTIWAFVPLLLASGIIGEFIKPIPIVVTTTMLASTSIAVLITLPLLMVILKPNIPPRVKLLLKILIIGLVVGMGLFLLPKGPLFPLIALAFLVFAALTYRVRNTITAEGRSRITLPPTAQRFLKRARGIVDHGLIDMEHLSRQYMMIIDRIITSQSARRKTMAALVIFALAAYLLVPLGLVKNEFFPKTDEDILYVNVELPAGTNIATTRPEALRLLDELKKTEEVEYIILETGTAASAENRSANSGAFSYTLHLKEERNVSSIDLAERMRERYKTYTKGKLVVRELSGGPPAGSDLQIKLLGEDLTVLDQYANQIVAFLQKQPGVFDPEKSIKPGTSKLVFVPDRVKLTEAGLTPDALGLWLRTFASGFTLDTLKVDGTETDIIFRMSSQSLTPQDIGTLSVPTPNGAVPLLALGSLKLESNPTLITHEQGKRTISVSAGVSKGYVITDKNKDLEAFANSLNLPTGYSWQTGGANEENAKSIQSILNAMGLSFLLILATMVIEFGSFRQALLTLLVIPLAIPGVFYVFALTGTPLSFPALIGILALFGIVVTNAIVVVEKINDNRKHGMDLRSAVVDASGSRLEPVLLTSVTSILGLLPITISDPLWRGLGGAIISGLLFSGIVKLFFVPIVYYMWYIGDENKHKKTLARKS